MDVLQLQAELARAGYDPGAQDGVAGFRTYAALFSYMAQRDLGDRGLALGRGGVGHFAAYGIDSAIRLAHFVAQAAHETEGFQYFREIWGPTRAQRGYEGRADLGNVKGGDGFLFRGRGIFQLTGRANYAAFGARLGLDLVGHPELVEQPDVAMLTACAFWQDRGLSALADADDIVGITRRINGGTNGLADRQALLARAKAVLP